MKDEAGWVREPKTLVLHWLQICSPRLKKWSSSRRGPTRLFDALGGDGGPRTQDPVPVRLRHAIAPRSLRVLQRKYETMSNKTVCTTYMVLWMYGHEWELIDKVGRVSSRALGNQGGGVVREKKISGGKTALQQSNSSKALEAAGQRHVDPAKEQ